MAPGPKQNKKQSNGNGNDAELIPGMGRLTQRELEIFTLIDLGFSTRELTAKLDVSPYTVQAHRNHIKINSVYPIQRPLLTGQSVGASQDLALFHWRPSPIAATIRRGYRSRSIEALPHL